MKLQRVVITAANLANVFEGTTFDTLTESQRPSVDAKLDRIEVIPTTPSGGLTADFHLQYEREVGDWFPIVEVTALSLEPQGYANNLGGIFVLSDFASNFAKLRYRARTNSGQGQNVTIILYFEA